MSNTGQSLNEILSNEEINKMRQENLNNKSFSLFAKSIFLLQELVKIESVSGTEDEIIHYIEDKIRRLYIPNIKLNRIGKNLIVEYKTKMNQKNIAFISHVDTVPFLNDSWTKDPLGALIEDGKMYGRGTTDSKSGIAILLTLIENIKYESPNMNPVFIFFSGEETGTPNGLTRVISAKSMDELEYAIIIEPTDRKIITGCYGDLAAELTIFGRAGHSSQPEKARNAIMESAKFIEMFQKCIKLENFKDEVISVTQINTFNTVNVIPGEVKIGINYRYNPHKKDWEAEETLKNLIMKLDGRINKKLEIIYNDKGCATDFLHDDLRDISVKNQIPVDRPLQN